MASRMKELLATMATTLAIVGCASTPPNVQSISSGANPPMEIERTEEMLKEAHDQQVDVLSPENYADARKSLDKAKKKLSDGKSKEDILKHVSYSRAWLNEAKAKAELVETSMKDISDARAGALRAGAPSIAPKEWKKAEEDLQEITRAAEKGNMKQADKNGDELTKRYRDIEVMTVTKSNLGIAEENIKAAKKDGADKKAPKTYSMTTMKRDNVERMIKADPRNDVAIRRAAEDATRESMHLIDVVAKVNAGNTEDLVLMAERQQRTISSLKSEQTSTEQELQSSKKELTQAETALSQAERERQELAMKQAELEKSQELLQKAEQLRRQFKPNEAEVYAEGGKLKIRLKSLQFPSGQARLGPKNQAFLKKVETALAEVEPARITIEGHTDATGRAETNRVLSEKRAQAVGDFFISEGNIPGPKIEAVGRGSDDPVSDNDTSRGRAENRRIDMVIETE